MDPFASIQEHLEELHINFKIQKLGIFGSYARGEARPDSDVDILVVFEGPVDIFHFMYLQDYLEAIVNRRVELVTEKALRPETREKTLKEVKYLWPEPRWHT